MTDAECVAMVLDGDVNAYRHLVQKYQGAVFGISYRMVDNFADAEDLAQESFVRAFLDLHQLNDHHRFAGWLRQVTLNVCRIWLRQRKAEFVSIEEAKTIPAYQPDLLEKLEEREAHEQLRQAIASLSEEARTILTLYYLDGLSYSDIGNFLEVPATTIKSRLYRARQKLKKEMVRMVEETFQQHKVGEAFTQKVESALEETLQVLKQLSNVILPRNNAVKRLFGLAERYDASLQVDTDRDQLRLGIFRDICQQKRESAFKAALKLISSAVEANERWLQTQAIVALDVLKMAEEDEPRRPDDINILFGFLIGQIVDEYFELKSSDWSCVSAGNYGLFEQIIRTQPKVLRKHKPVGTTWQDEKLEGLTTIVRETKIESDDDTVTVPAGTFEHCLKICTTISCRRRDQDKGNRSQTVWLAPGVGVVKLSNDESGDIELYSWAVPEKTKDYLPLVLGSMWRYEWYDKIFEARTAEVYRLMWQKGEDFYLSRARYTFGNVSDSEFFKKFITASKDTPIRPAEKGFIPTKKQRNIGIWFADDFENDGLNTEPAYWKYQGVKQRGKVMLDPLNLDNRVFSPHPEGTSTAMCPQDGFYSVGDTTWTDYIVEWDWLVTDESQLQAIAFRYRDIMHYYCFARSADKILFGIKSPGDEGGEKVRKAGIWDNLPNLWYRLQLQVEGMHFILKAKEKSDLTPFFDIEPLCQIDIEAQLQKEADHLKKIGFLRPDCERREYYATGGIAFVDGGYVDNIRVSSVECRTPKTIPILCK